MNLNRERTHSDSAKRVAEAEPIQDAVGIGANLDAGADLTELGRLFENRNLEARSAKRQRRCESADSRADHDHSHTVYSPNG
jgi:hypothetical protein